MSRLTTLRLAVAATLITVCSGGAIVASQKSAANMTRTASGFLDSLTPEQRVKATFPFESDERMRWHFIPNETFARKGLMIKDMNEAQRRLAHDLLRTGMSARGYLKVTSIMELEDILKATEAGGKFARNKEEYLFTIFGTPAAKGRWGWRVEGHHVSVRFAVVDGAMKDAVASSPMFLGTNPAEVREDSPKKGLRVLAEEEDAARALLMSLPGDVQASAVVNPVAPGDILTMNKNDITPLPQHGVRFGAMGAQQQALLMKLIEVYTSNMEADIAAERLAKIKAAGMDEVRFAWLGETDKGKKHYYSVQGPTFLIEYDNTQNNGNHVHSVWRDFSGDFGRDILREHLKEVVH